MIKKNLSALTTMLLIGAIPRIGISDPGLVRTTYALDDARGYCLDIRGFGQNIQLDAPLQVHTCKYGAALSDQVFEQPAGSAMLRVVEYDRCLAVAAHEPGAELLVRACEDAPLQRWDFAWGRLTPEARTRRMCTIRCTPSVRPTRLRSTGKMTSLKGLCCSSKYRSIPNVQKTPKAGAIATMMTATMPRKRINDIKAIMP